ncbi:MAG: hypothetical protein JWN04_1763 [Myxococcaceae bacterium]|nr:hypothetical protein [Myxococcaceae bacterium]
MSLSKQVLSLFSGCSQAVAALVLLGCGSEHASAPIVDAAAALQDATVARGDGSADGFTSEAGTLSVDAAVGQPADSGGDAAALDGAQSPPGSLPCGDQVCSASQVCVHPSCGGGVQPPCLASDDASVCPSGFHRDATCPSGGCRRDLCTPLPAFCADLPAECSPGVDCACLPTNVCQGHGACMLTTGRTVSCGSA